MELQIKNQNLPLRNYPQNDLEAFLSTQFKFWIASTFRIKTANSESLEGAIEGVKAHCWSMPMSEIKKAFEMYADSKLNLEPISGFMDRVLVGKIISAYKDQLPRPKNPIIEPPQISEQEKKKLLDDGVTECYLHFLETGNIKTGKNWVYDYLTEQGEIKHDKAFKVECMQKAKANLLNDAKDITKLSDRKAFITKLEDKGKNGKVIAEAKRVALIDYFLNKK